MSFLPELENNFLCDEAEAGRQSWLLRGGGVLCPSLLFYWQINRVPSFPPPYSCSPLRLLCEIPVIRVPVVSVGMPGSVNVLPQLFLVIGSSAYPTEVLWKSQQRREILVRRKLGLGGRFSSFKRLGFLKRVLVFLLHNSFRLKKKKRKKCTLRAN